MINKTAIILVLAMLQLAAHAQQTYQLDAAKSKILWNTHNTVGGHYGSLLFNSGSLIYSASGEPAGGSFSMDMNSMKSADHTSAAENQKVDKELRTPGFFAVTQYPVATISVKQIARIGNSTTYKVTADLTIKGITNPIEFTADIKPKGNTINATAELELHRFIWKIDMQPQPKTWNFLAALKDQMIADAVAISLNLVFVK